ncbi:MAG: DUF6557 family protein [Clostridia bacterium]
MLVIDLLKIYTVKEIVDALMKNHKIDEEKYQRVYDVHKKFISDLLKLTPIFTDKIVLGHYYEEFGEIVFTQSVYLIDDLKKDYDIQNSLNKLKGMEKKSAEELSEIIHSNKFPQNYGVIFVDWEEILGYQVSEKNIQSFGGANLMSELIYNMTFDGFAKEDMKKGRKKLEKSIKESEEINKLPIEEREKHYTNIEDFFESLGLERKTEEEKRISHENLIREIAKNQVLTYQILKDVCES